VKIGAVASKFKRATFENVPRLGMQSDNHRLFGKLAYTHNFDFNRLAGNHFCTSSENLVRFGLDVRICTVGVKNFTGVTIQPCSQWDGAARQSGDQ